MKKKLAINTISSLIFQLLTIICGFILPRLYLTVYGSKVNGLLNSVTQFLSIISLLDLGVGEVVRSSLYKPLVDNNNSQISEVVYSAKKFFRRIAFIFLGYIGILIIIFPKLTNNDFSFVYSAALILAVSISLFAQYYFGITNSILLSADQKGYIIYNTQIITLIINTIASVVLIKLGASIHVVKLGTSIIYFFRPLYFQYYVRKHYLIDRSIKPTKDPLLQKWNGISQHISTVVLNHTDTIVLTIFGTLEAVSVYSVYHFVVYGVKNIFDASVIGIKPLFGELWARGNKNKLLSTFNLIEWTIHNAVILLFGCTALLIVPFISVYTKGVNDTNYIQKSFAYLITYAYAVHCLRLPNNMLILASGHFKQTQVYYTVAATINVVVSIVTVSKYGLIGVSIGTLSAMVFHTIWNTIYTTKNLLNRPYRIYFKQIAFDFLTSILGFAVLKIIPAFRGENYLQWVIYSFISFILWLLVQVILNIIIYRSNMVYIIKTFVACNANKSAR